VALLTDPTRKPAARGSPAQRRSSRPKASVPRPPWAPVQRLAGDGPSAPRAAEVPGQTGLPPALKAGVETLSDWAMDDVRVHRNSPEPASLDALAFTRGTDIHLGPGQERHLPHEAWHVVQQKQGRVPSTLQLHGMAVNDDAALEREATVQGATALRLGGAMGSGGDLGCGCAACAGAMPLLAGAASPLAHGGVAQRATYDTAADANNNFDARYQVMLHGRLHIGGANPIDQWAISQSSSYNVGATVHIERDHAEDEFIGWSETILGAFYDGVIVPNAALVPPGHNFPIEMEIFGLSASPCSSVRGTSNKAVGCTEELIDLATNGIQNLPYTFSISVEADHLYQPGHMGRIAGRAASQLAVEDMEQANITVDIDH